MDRGTPWERAIAQVQGEKSGTGVVVDRDKRLLLTCAHILGSEKQAQVRFPGHDASLVGEVIENWAPDLDAALLHVREALPEGITEAPLGLEIVAGHRFRSRGYHYAGEGVPIPIEGEIRGLGELGSQPAIILSSTEVGEGMSGAPLVDADSGLVVGLIRRYHEQERWLACGVPISAIADHWPCLRELTVEARYRNLLRAAYGFWERRFTPLEMTAQERERLPEARRGWIPPCFSALEEQEVQEIQEGEPPPIRRVPLPGGLTEALDRYGAVVLLGEPGAGKTTALAHLAGQLAPAPACLPILVPLRRYERGEEPWAFLRRAWAMALQDDLAWAIQAGETEGVPIDRVEKAIAPLATLLEHLLERGRLVLLLDGLNEMPGLVSDDPRLSRLAAFVERARAQGNRMVVACRVLDYAALRRPLEHPLHQVTLEPLDADRIYAFLCAYLGDEEGEKLARWLKGPERRAVQELCRMPFFLRLIAYLYEREGEPPARRMDLLEQYVQVAVKREQERLREDWPPVLLVGPLSDLALAMQERGVLEVWESEARPYLDAFPKGGANAALRVAEGAGLLRAALTPDLRGARLSFVHQLWQQDMAAQALVRRVEGNGVALFKALRPHLLDERWTKVVTLAAAQLEDANSLLERLLKVNMRDKDQQCPLFLVAAALAEGVRGEEAVRRRVVEELERLARTRDLWERPKRASAGKALAALGWLKEETRAVQRLLALAQDGRLKPEVRISAAETLGCLGRADEAVFILLALACDGRMDSLVRLEAAKALGRLGRADTLLSLALDGRGNWWVRVEAAKALGHLGWVDEAVPILLSLARDGGVNWWVRVEAAEALGHLGWVDEVVPTLLFLARGNRGEPAARVEAAEALGHMGRVDEAIPILLSLARDDKIDWGVHLRAAKALGRLGRPDDAAQAWVALACDSRADWWVRSKAVGALCDMGQVVATPAVMSGLRALAEAATAPEEVRRAAHRALRRLESQLE